MTKFNIARGLIAEFQDIDVQATETLLPAVLHHCPLPINVKDLNGRYLLVNPASEKLLSNNGESIIGKTAAEIFTPEVARAVLAQDRQVTSSKEVVDAQYRIEINGVLRTFTSVRFPIFDNAGEVVAVGGIHTDLTSQIAASAALLNSENRFHDFANVAADWFWEMDADLRFTYQSERFEEITGISPENALGRTREQTFAGLIDDDTKWRRGRHTLMARQDYEMEWSIIHKDGKTRVLQTIGHPRYDSFGVFLGYRGVGREVTAARQAQAERESLISELERKNEELEKFAYSVSHDLKSPLLTIRGYLGLVEKGLDNSDLTTVKSDIARIHSAAINMQALLRDLLDLTKVGRGIECFENCPMDELLRDALQALSATVESVNAAVYVQPDLPSVHGERKQLTLVLQNLIENATKFRGAQPLKIDVGFDPERSGGVFYVRDNGIGVEPRFHEKIFALFERLDTNVDGTGLGLALSKRIIEHHGGRLWVESDGLDHGSTFFFQLSAIESIQ